MPASKPSRTLILSCEHGGNRIPAAYRSLFKGQAHLLATHRGWDLGALEAARLMRRRLQVPLFAATVSRLVVDLNRSLNHPNLLSPFTQQLAALERQRLLQHHYTPHRAAIETVIKRHPGGVLHFCVHSFTPVLNGVVRQTDVALLYDPRRPGERAFCQRFRRAWFDLCPDLRLRFNYPYKGTSDGLATALRRHYADQRYAGIELEINQRHVLRGGERWKMLQRALCTCLRQSV